MQSVLTSELLLYSTNMMDKYSEEFGRRLESLKLSPTQITDLGKTDMIILEAADYTQLSGKDEESRIKCSVLIEERYNTPGYFWHNRSPFKYEVRELPDPHMLTMSELMLMSEQANAMYNSPQYSDFGENDFYRKLCEIVAYSPSSIGTPSGIYYNEFYKRAKRMGWTVEQAFLFWENDFIILKREQWGGYPDSYGRPWTDKTTNIQDFGYSSVGPR